MSDESGLLTLNCPNCGGILQCRSADMVVNCEHCGTSIVIKDFITKSRINNQDKLQSNIVLAKNAIDVKDWKSAYKYYEGICKISPEQKYLDKMNVIGYLSGKVELSRNLLESCRNFDIDERKQYLSYMLNHVNELRSDEISRRTGNTRDQKRRNEIARQINSSYAPTVNAIVSELKIIEPIKCTCGGVLQYNDSNCPKCNKAKEQIVKEQKEAKRKKDMILIGVIVALVILFMIIGLVNQDHSDRGKSSRKTDSAIGVMATSQIKEYDAVQLSHDIDKNKKLVDELKGQTIKISGVVKENTLSDDLWIAADFKSTGWIQCKMSDNKSANSGQSVVVQGVVDKYIGHLYMVDCQLIKSEAVTKAAETTSEKAKETKMTTAEQAATEASTVASEIKDETAAPPVQAETQQQAEPETETEAPVVEQQEETENNSVAYILNTKTHKFHYSGCQDVGKISPENYDTFNGTRDEIIAQGYEPCGHCKP